MGALFNQPLFNRGLFASVGQGLAVFRNGLALSVKSTTVSNDLSGQTSQATIVYTVPIGGNAGSPFDEIQIYDDTGAIIFGGFIAKVAIIDPRGSGFIEATAQCRDYRILTDTSVITKNYSGNPTDQSIILDAFANFGPIDIIASSANIAVIKTFSTATSPVSFSNNTLSQLMDQICKATGGGWRIGPDKTLYYSIATSGGTAAPFALSDAPDNINSFAFAGKCDFSEDFFTPCNKVTLLGSVAANGTAIVVTSQDAPSQTTYGRVFAAVLTDNTIIDPAIAQATADNYIATQKAPKITLTVKCWTRGLAVGQVLNVTKAAYGWTAKPFVIQKITITKLMAQGPQSVTYDLALGDYRPDLFKTLVAKTQTAIVNSAFQPVPPYTPIALASASLSIAMLGVNYNSTYDGDHSATIVNIASVAGQLYYIGARITSIGGYIAGGSPLTYGNWSWWIEITIDGQPAIRYYLMDTQQTNSAAASWSPESQAAFNAGVATAHDSAALGDSMSIFLPLPHATSLLVKIGYTLGGLPTSPTVWGGVGNDFTFEASVVRGERFT